MPVTYIPWRNLLNDHLKESSENRSSWLKVQLIESVLNNQPGRIVSAINDVIKANFSVAEIAEKAEINKESLYKILSGDKDIRISTLFKLLHAIDEGIFANDNEMEIINTEWEDIAHPIEEPDKKTHDSTSDDYTFGQVAHRK